GTTPLLSRRGLFASGTDLAANSWAEYLAARSPRNNTLEDRGIGVFPGDRPSRPSQADLGLRSRRRPNRGGHLKGVTPMQGRSRMAAGSIVASLLGIVPLTVWAEDVTDVHKVKLELRIAGVGRNGCDIEIKPGHAGCKFQVIRHHLAGDRGWGQLQLVLD